MKVNILGVKYTIEKSNMKKIEKLKKCDAFCDTTIKKIVILDQSPWKNDPDCVKDLDYYEKKVTRHEIIHAFLYESGVWNNSNDVDGWAMNEEMVDWIAIQFPKLLKVFQEADCL